MTEQPFNPTIAIARYRELEVLLNLELINRPDWQQQRAQGDTTFLQESKYFIEQEKLLETIVANGYDILADEDEETRKPIYEIEKVSHHD